MTAVPSGFERVQLPDGAMLRRRAGEGAGDVQGDVQGDVRGDVPPLLPEHFDPEWWVDRNRVVGSAVGRGRVRFISPAGTAAQWALRHCERGGMVRAVLGDRYFWRGEGAVRAFRELLLLERLHRAALPVPVPVGARYRRSGPWYRADILTERLPETTPLSTLLAGGDVSAETWTAIGRTIRRFHDAGADHPDLNAHNVLVADLADRAGADCVWLLDFDRGTVRAPGAWRARNLARLERSLRKLTGATPPGWSELVTAYHGSGAE